MGVALCACTAGTVLVIKVIVTIWGTSRSGVSGLVTIYDGNCSKSKKLNLWIHLAINIWSTLLLGASNYCMQCLSSPSRPEIDKAHNQNIWLDIGVPSVRNLRRVSWNKIVLWWLFAISSIPLHLLYKSAIFSTIGANEYAVFIVPESVVTRVGLDWSLPLDCTPGNTSACPQQAAKFVNLTIDECVEVYSKVYVTSNTNVLAVTPSDDSSLGLNSTNPLYLYSMNNADFGLQCNYPDSVSSCDTSAQSAEATKWSLGGYLIESYCISQSIEGYFTLRYRLLICHSRDRLQCYEVGVHDGVAVTPAGEAFGDSRRRCRIVPSDA